MTPEAKHFIGGKWMDGKSDNTVTVKNPYTGEILSTIKEPSPAQIQSAIQSAKEGAKTAKKLTAAERANILTKTASLIENNKEDIAKLITAESGKPIFSSRVEAGRGAETFQFAAEEAKRISGETIPMEASAAGKNHFGYTLRVPLGIIAAITPFNFPLNLVAHKVAPAIASGNACILKPAEATPLTAVKLTQFLLEAGLPENMLQLLIGYGHTAGDALVTHEDIAMISFTGSARAGVEIKKKAGMKRVVLELGSNSAVIVDESANMDEAVPTCVTGSFVNAGQVCISVQRIYAHKNIFNAFTEKFLDATRKIQTGDPMDEKTLVGPMINEAQAKRAQEWLKQAEDNGAKTLCGGARDGSFITPAVLTNVKDNMAVMCEEVFAPVASLIPFERFEDAVKMANDSKYGLQCGVYTQNLTHANFAISELETGTVLINEVPTFRVDHMPYGGVKLSGTGREGLKYAIQEMTDLKLVCIRT